MAFIIHEIEDSDMDDLPDLVDTSAGTASQNGNGNHL
jgi:hypothetical protein